MALPRITRLPRTCPLPRRPRLQPSTPKRRRLPFAARKRRSVCRLAMSSCLCAKVHNELTLNGQAGTMPTLGLRSSYPPPRSAPTAGYAAFQVTKEPLGTSVVPAPEKNKATTPWRTVDAVTFRLSNEPSGRWTRTFVPASCSVEWICSGSRIATRPSPSNSGIRTRPLVRCSNVSITCGITQCRSVAEPATRRSSNRKKPMRSRRAATTTATTRTPSQRRHTTRVANVAMPKVDHPSDAVHRAERRLDRDEPFDTAGANVSAARASPPSPRRKRDTRQDTRHR